MPVPVEEGTKSGTKTFQIPQISLVMLLVNGLAIRSHQRSQVLIVL
jgi:hypothetical protein